MFESHLKTCIDWMSFEFRFELKNKLPVILTNHPYWRSVLNFKSFILPFQMSCLMSIEPEMCKEKILQSNSNAIICIIQFECYNMYKWKVCSQEFRYILSSLSGIDIRLENWAMLSYNENSERKRIQKIGFRLRDMTSHPPFLSVHWYEPIAQWLRPVAVSRTTWVR